MKKKILAVLAALLLLASAAVPALAEETGEPEGAEADIVAVGNVVVTPENAADVMGDGKVSYDFSSRTLTLDGAEITSAYTYHTDSVAAIYSSGDLNIVVKETVEVASENALCTLGIYCEGKLTVSGDGALLVSAGEAITDVTEAVAESIGIAADEGMVIDGSEVYTIGDNAINTADSGYAYTRGLYVIGGLTLKNGAQLSAFTYEAKASFSGTCGIQTMDGDFVMDGAYLSSQARSASGHYPMSMALYVETGDFNITNPKANVYLLCDTAISDVAGSSFSACIYMFGSDLNMNGGNLNMTLTESEGNRGFEFGITTMTINRPDTEPFGGNVNINSGEISLREDKRGFYGSSLNIKVPEAGNAIYAEAGITLADNVCITEPEGATVAKREEEDTGKYTAVADADGNDAANVVIGIKMNNIKINYGSFTVEYPVPVGMSPEAAYETDDFNEIIEQEKDGYTLVGWYTDEACTEGNEVDFGAVLSGDMQIYPKYVAVVPPTGDCGVLVLAIIALAAALAIYKAVKRT